MSHLIVGKFALENPYYSTLPELKMAHSKTPETRRQKLEAIRKLLAKECGNDGLKFDEPCQGY